MASQREVIRDELAEFLADVGLAEVYGAVTGVTTPKRNTKAVISYNVTFCKARVTDGEVRVYSPAKIEIYWRTAKRTLPQTGTEVFTDKYEAMKFLHINFS